MNRSMITATNTMNQLQKQMDTIGHNLANTNTTGYKRRQVNFSDLLFQQFNNQPRGNNEVGRLTPNGIRQGVGAKLGHTNIVSTQGVIKTTERPLDIAFTKENQFLQVLVEENGVPYTRYTRDGALYVTPLADGSDQVMLVTGDGYPVLDQDGEQIVFDKDSQNITFSEDGVLTVEGNGVQTFNLGVVQINRPQMLEALGQNLFGFDNAAGDIQDMVTFLQGDLRQEVALQQGALEQSNVDMATEMSELMITQRSYQFNAKSISIADQMMGLVNGIR